VFTRGVEVRFVVVQFSLTPQPCRMASGWLTSCDAQWAAAVQAGIAPACPALCVHAGQSAAAMAFGLVVLFCL
jgi:hypothetical protein